MLTKRKGKKIVTFKITTPNGEFDAVRVDKDFLCKCGCGRTIRRNNKYASAQCRLRMGNKSITTQITKSIIQTNENTTLLIQLLLTKGKES